MLIIWSIVCAFSNLCALSATPARALPESRCGGFPESLHCCGGSFWALLGQVQDLLTSMFMRSITSLPSDRCMLVPPLGAALTFFRCLLQSVQHENTYRNPQAKYCYGESPPELLPVWTFRSFHEQIRRSSTIRWASRMILHHYETETELLDFQTDNSRFVCDVILHFISA